MRSTEEPPTREMNWLDILAISLYRGKVAPHLALRAPGHTHSRLARALEKPALPQTHQRPGSQGENTKLTASSVRNRHCPHHTIAPSPGNAPPFLSPSQALEQPGWHSGATETKKVTQVSQQTYFPFPLPSSQGGSSLFLRHSPYTDRLCDQQLRPWAEGRGCRRLMVFCWNFLGLKKGWDETAPDSAPPA